MELKIYSPQDTGFIQKIDWNYDELKKEIAAAAYEEVSPGRRVDPETGEIFEDRRNGPIDLRRQQA